MTVDERETEADRVFAWRRQTLLDCGYPADHVDQLASAAYVDLTGACDLLAHGCDPLIAVDILL